MLSGATLDEDLVQPQILSGATWDEDILVEPTVVDISSGFPAQMDASADAFSVRLFPIFAWCQSSYPSLAEYTLRFMCCPHATLCT